MLRIGLNLEALKNIFFRNFPINTYVLTTKITTSEGLKFCKLFSGYNMRERNKKALGRCKVSN